MKTDERGAGTGRESSLKALEVCLTAITFALALHVLLILFTGGYTFSAHGLAITGREITSPIILVFALVTLRLPVRDRTLSLDVFFHHEVAILFSVLMIIYLANERTFGASDTLPARYLPLSILRDGNFYLDKFPFLYDQDRVPSFLRFVNGHYVSEYPVGAALLAIPFYLASALGGVAPQSQLIAELEKLSAAATVALSAVVLYFALRQVIDRRDSLFITALYALGTSSLSEISQGLWQHGASQLALAVALYCLVRGRLEAGWVKIAGFPLAFAVTSRPTDVLLALPLGIYVLVHHRRDVWGFLLSGIPPILFQLWYNAAYFGNPFRVQFFFTPSAAVRDLSLGAGNWSTPFWNGLAGILLSPGRGLLIYSPIFLMSVIGIGLAWKSDGDRLLRYASVGVLLTVLVYSKWNVWWGGWTYGPRLLADLSPVLTLLLYPLSTLLQTKCSRVLKIASMILATWSIGAHSIGAFADDRSWNAYVDVDDAPGRLWSWTDNQLVNSLREAFASARITMLRLPTSQSAPALLSVSYRTESSAALTVTGCEAVRIVVTATNVGRAVWLSKSTRDKGVVSLAWRWRRGALLGPAGEGRLPLRVPLFPGESYEFRASITPPEESGTYPLEVGLVSERVGWFSEHGSPAIQIGVTVNRAPRLPQQADAFSGLLERLRTLADEAPSLILLTDQPRYDATGVLRLSVTGSVRERPGLIDAYLLLRDSGGAVWFYDGNRLVHDEGCGWTPLVKAVRLEKGRHSGPLLALPLGGMPSGPYTWHLLVTEGGGYKILADSQTSFAIAPTE
jgi:hypothetical protein